MPATPRKLPAPIRLLAPSERVRLLLLAVVVGVAAGYGAVGFRELISLFQRFAWSDAHDLLAGAARLSWWWLLIIPTAGGLVVGPLVTRFASEARGHGVPEVMEAVARNGGRIRPRVAAVKTLASAITIGTGGSVGREGPIVQIGSAIGSGVGQLFRLRPSQVQTLVGCGAAAGIAATFNAPIAGCLFALELLLGNFAMELFAPIVVSSVLATIVSRHHFGNVPAFAIPAYKLVSGWEVFPYFGLGLLVGVTAVGFTRVIYLFEDGFERLPIPVAWRAWLGGLGVGAIAILCPFVLGNGYETVEGMLHLEVGGTGHDMIHDLLAGKGLIGFVPLALLGLIVAKVLATALTLGSGGSGGIFSPSLFLGCVVGYLFGMGCNAIAPDMTGPPSAYALVAMSGMVAGTTHAPITAILILFELTADYAIILPLMLTSIVASLVARAISEESIYTLKLVRRGVQIRAGPEEAAMRTLRTRDVMRAGTEPVRSGSPIGEVIDRFLGGRRDTVFVLDESERYRGCIRLQDVLPVVNEPDDVKRLVIAADLANETVRPVAPETPLTDVMERLWAADLDELPVADAGGKYLGYIAQRDIIGAYNREVLRKQHLLAKLVSRGESGDQTTDYVELPRDYVVDQVPVPEALDGCTLEQAHLRDRHGLNVLEIKTEADGELRRLPPFPGRAMRSGELLVVVGKRNAIERFRRVISVSGRCAPVSSSDGDEAAASP